jgi:hypothetical protein
MPPIPADATVSLGYSAKDMPQRWKPYFLPLKYAYSRRIYCLSSYVIYSKNPP